MELAWQKEREEHQRLLQETATLARDLRQTLFEVLTNNLAYTINEKIKLIQILYDSINFILTDRKRAQ